MHTISFYSYKGGVGRSLAVYYFAKELAALGKKVIAIDFDFEAPGLPYKFNVKREDIKKRVMKLEADREVARFHKGKR